MTKILTKEEWKKKRRIKRILVLAAIMVLLIVILAMGVYLLAQIFMLQTGSNNKGKDALTVSLSNGEIVKEDYLTINPYSRPGTRLKNINGVVIHYTANPGTSAENNRSYFQGLAETKLTKASSHYIIGLDGEILQCIPLTEESYASNERNVDTVSIECCHPDETGEFNEKTYASLVSLTAALCEEFDLQEEDVIRHYDVTKKECPLYYVKHEDAWQTLKQDIMNDLKSRIESAAAQ